MDPDCNVMKVLRAAKSRPESFLQHFLFLMFCGPDFYKALQMDPANIECPADAASFLSELTDLRPFCHCCLKMNEDSQMNVRGIVDIAVKCLSPLEISNLRALYHLDIIVKNQRSSLWAKSEFALDNHYGIYYHDVGVSGRKDDDHSDHIDKELGACNPSAICALLDKFANDFRNSKGKEILEGAAMKKFPYKKKMSGEKRFAYMFLVRWWPGLYLPEDERALWESRKTPEEKKKELIEAEARADDIFRQSGRKRGAAEADLDSQQDKGSTSAAAAAAADDIPPKAKKRKIQ